MKVHAPLVHRTASGISQTLLTQIYCTRSLVLVETTLKLILEAQVSLGTRGPEFDEFVQCPLVRWF